MASFQDEEEDEYENIKEKLKRKVDVIPIKSVQEEVESSEVVRKRLMRKGTKNITAPEMKTFHIATPNVSSLNV